MHHQITHGMTLNIDFKSNILLKIKKAINNYQVVGIDYFIIIYHPSIPCTLTLAPISF